MLQVAELGDSGVRLIRNGQVVFRSHPGEHFFDCPYQFGSECTDTADMAEVRPPVCVVMCTCGFHDNP